MPAPLRIVRHFSGGGHCITEYLPTERWLRTTWQGFISPADAELGAEAILIPMQSGAMPYLLNDNSLVQGPWFDSLHWLQHVWAPQAAHLGLRYVAHVAQPHTEADLGAILGPSPFRNYFDLQLFTSLEDATAWLRECQQHSPRGAA